MLDESARSAGESRDELQRGGKGIENLRCVVARGYIHKNAPVPVKNCRAANCEYLSADTTSRRPPSPFWRMVLIGRTTASRNLWISRLKLSVCLFILVASFSQIFRLCYVRRKSQNVSKEKNPFFNHGNHRHSHLPLFSIGSCHWTHWELWRNFQV